MKTPTFSPPKFNKPTVRRTPLPSMVKAPDPLKDLKQRDNPEDSCADEVTALQQAFRDRSKQEAARFTDATDTGFYTCVVFSNRAQNDAFLAAIGKLGKGDLYIDGRDLAEFMGIELPASGGGGKPGRIDKTFARMAKR